MRKTKYVYMEGLFTAEQKENLSFFRENLDIFAKDPLLRFKHIVIHNKKIAGAYDTPDAALAFAVRNFRQGEYVIQEVIRDDDVVSFLYPAVT